MMSGKRFHAAWLAVLYCVAGIVFWGKCDAAEDTAIRVAVYVSLCDNEHQGIVPVPVKIGKGDDPGNNLYWGCDDGLPSVFGKSRQWKLKAKEETKSPVLRKYVYWNEARKAELTAYAYKGDSIGRCMTDFEKAATDGKHDFVAFIGHNGLMDTTLGNAPEKKGERPCAVAILCCLSREYFTPRLQKMGVVPVLLTEQTMYPGAFLLHDALSLWLDGKGTKAIRQAAAKAYAANQKISVKAALGVFSDLSLQAGKEKKTD